MPRYYRQSRRSHHGHKWDAAHFVAWDGEGFYPHRPDERHPGICPSDCPATQRAQAYGYLAYWDKTRSTGNEVERFAEGGMTGPEALAFVVSEGTLCGKDATHVCYGLSYDANQWLQGVDRESLRDIRRGEKVEVFDRFRVEYRARKSMWVQDTTTEYGIKIWDPFGFYQSSFIKAVEDNLGRDDPRLPNIRQGKATRSLFTAEHAGFIRGYTHDELTALGDLMMKLRIAVDGVALKLTRWDGAGAVAAAMLDKYRFKTHIPRHVGIDAPYDLNEASLMAYSGGRIEMPRYGFYVGPVYHVDIRSAYPYAFSWMPSLTHGKWLNHNDVPKSRFSMVKVAWDFSDEKVARDWPFLPFKLRTLDSAIYYPTKGHGWVWKDELDAAFEQRALKPCIDVEETWEFVPDEPDARPFAWMEYEIYDERARRIAAGDPSQHVLKLGGNSVYGKTAQNVGGRWVKGVFFPPPYHQLEYAGFITAATRASVFRVAAPVRHSVISFATDGIMAIEPMKVDVGKHLGQWDSSVHDLILAAQSGVYWYRNPVEDATRCGRCHGPTRPSYLGSVECRDPRCAWSSLTHHFRGFDPGSLNPDQILDAWKKKKTNVTVQSTRFVTLGSAHLDEARYRNWRRWMTTDRTLDIYATGKRIDRLIPSRWTARASPAHGLMGTDPAEPDEMESQPYNLKFAKEEGAESADAQEQTSL